MFPPYRGFGVRNKDIRKLLEATTPPSLVKSYAVRDSSPARRFLSLCGLRGLGVRPSLRLFHALHLKGAGRAWSTPKASRGLNPGSFTPLQLAAPSNI
jgi:hypothetical protein